MRKIKIQKIAAQRMIPYIGKTATIVAIAIPKIAECEIASAKYAIFLQSTKTPIGAVATPIPIAAMMALISNMDVI